MQSLFAAAVAVTAIAASGPAFAQDVLSTTVTPNAPVTGLYGTLGYDQTTSGHDLGALQGRLGWRFDRWFGVEGEVAAGVEGAQYGTPATGRAEVNLNHQEAVYGVFYLPVTPRIDLLARGGIGNTAVSVQLPPGASYLNHGSSWNYGAGAQFKLSDANAIRADWTRIDYRDFGAGQDDVWSLAFAHRF